MMNTITQTIPLEMTETSSVSCQTDIQDPTNISPEVHQIGNNLNSQRVDSDKSSFENSNAGLQKDQNATLLNNEPKQESKPKWMLKSPSRSSLSLREFLKSSKLGGCEEETVTMISSVGDDSEEEEGEHYYDDPGNTFCESDVESLGAAAGFEWDPDNRGNI